jgi:hypothetical protein
MLEFLVVFYVNEKFEAESKNQKFNARLLISCSYLNNKKKC